MILFDEFCDWAIKKQFDLHDDDDQDESPDDHMQKVAQSGRKQSGVRRKSAR
jgi:hypothetical protein